MNLIVGPERGELIGEWAVRDADRCSTPLLETFEEPRIYWPASYWPEVEALVQFDAERTRLGLPSLEGALWQ